MLSYVIPVLAIVLLGAVLRRMRRVPESLFPAMEWFSFYVAFPALLFVGAARLKLSASDALDLSLAALLPTLLLTAVVLLALRFAPRLSGPSRSSVLQGAVRPSSYFGLAVAALLFPPETTAMVMLALAICLPVVNVIAVVALAVWGNGDASARGIARALARNPIILATLAGLLLRGPAYRLQRLHHGAADGRRRPADGLTGDLADAAGRGDRAAGDAAAGLAGLSLTRPADLPVPATSPAPPPACGCGIPASSGSR
nr:hypothetical protein [uncultured Pseudoxanthomonas sp.]